MIPRMTTGNWIFWGIMGFIGVNLIWIGLVERYLPQWIGATLGVAVLVLCIVIGPRPREGNENGE